MLQLHASPSYVMLALVLSWHLPSSVSYQNAPCHAHTCSKTCPIASTWTQASFKYIAGGIQTCVYFSSTRYNSSLIGPMDAIRIL
ncbi:hypothetical protein BDW62DRAFT_173978 [Aspergillus aurantiobrunneus]